MLKLIVDAIRNLKQSLLNTRLSANKNNLFNKLIINNTFIIIIIINQPAMRFYSLSFKDQVQRYLRIVNVFNYTLALAAFF